MKKILLILTIVLVCSARSYSQQKNTTQEIDKLIAQYEEALNKHDVPSLMAFWAEDGDIVTVTGQWAAGKAEVQRLTTTLQSGVISDATYKIVNHWTRFVKPDVAIVDWQNIVSGMKGPAGKSLSPQRQHVTSLLVKQSGAWKILMMRPGSFSPVPADQQQEQ
jgi:uncharacterized protein (TIGR02246 family)